MSDHGDNEILEKLMSINLKQQPNTELIKMITDEKGDIVEDEVTSQLVLLARKLQRNQVTKRQVNRVVVINFYSTETSDRKKLKKVFSLDVDTKDTVNELIVKIEAERVKKELGLNHTISSFTYAGARMSGLLHDYSLKTGESIIYNLTKQL